MVVQSHTVPTSSAILCYYAMMEQHHYYYWSILLPTSTAARGAELCNPPTHEACFGEIWEAAIQMKLPVLSLWKSRVWKSHGIGLGWI